MNQNYSDSGKKDTQRVIEKYSQKYLTTSNTGKYQPTPQYSQRQKSLNQNQSQIYNANVNQSRNVPAQSSHINQLSSELSVLKENEKDYQDLNFLLINLEHRYNLLTDEKQRNEIEYDRRIETHLKSIATLKSTIDSLKDNELERENELSEARSECQALREVQQSRAQDFEALHDELAQLSSLNEKLTHDNAILDKHNKQMKSELQSIQDDSQQVRLQAEQKNSALLDAVSQIDQIKEDKDKLEKQFADFFKELENSNNVIRQKTQQAEGLTNANIELEKNCQEYLSDLEGMAQRAQEAQQRLGQAEAKVRDLQGQTENMVVLLEKQDEQIEIIKEKLIQAQFKNNNYETSQRNYESLIDRIKKYNCQIIDDENSIEYQLTQIKQAKMSKAQIEQEMMQQIKQIAQQLEETGKVASDNGTSFPKQYGSSQMAQFALVKPSFVNQQPYLMQKSYQVGTEMPFERLKNDQSRSNNKLNSEIKKSYSQDGPKTANNFYSKTPQLHDSAQKQKQ